MATAHGGEELLIASDVFNEAIVADDRGRDTTEVQVTSRRSRVFWLASFFISMIIGGVHYSALWVREGFK